MSKKTFYHAIPNSTVVIQRGEAQTETKTFYGGQLEVDETDEEALKFLEAIADKPGSFVTTKGRAQLTDAKVAAKEVQNLAAEAAAKIQGANPSAQ